MMVVYLISMKGAKNTEKEHLKIARESLAENKKQTKLTEKTITLSKRNLWIGLALIILSVASLFFLAGIKFDIDKFLGNKESPKEYDVAITVSPNKIIMNEDKDIYFTFTVQNTGLKKIKDFKIKKIVLYREIGSIVQQIGSGEDYGNNLAQIVHGFDVGDKYSFEVKLWACKKCFDDKDKTTQIIVYIESLPPINYQVIDLKLI